MKVTGRTDYRVKFTDLIVEPLYRLQISDVHPQIAIAMADAHDFVPGIQLPVHGFAKGTAGSNEDDFHDELLFYEKRHWSDATAAPVGSKNPLNRLISRSVF